MTLMVDNVSSNDTAFEYFKNKLRDDNKLIMVGECLHVRCVAHVQNLLVTDSLKDK